MYFFFSSRRRHTRYWRDWSSDVCSSDLGGFSRMRDPSDQLQCSFCGKSQRQVRKLIAGPGVYICDECIELCNEIIDEEFSGPEVLNDDDLPKPREINRILNEDRKSVV